MRKLFLGSVATAALIASSGFVAAQNQGQSSGQSTGSAPAEKSAPMSRETPTGKSNEMKGDQRSQKNPDAGTPRQAQDTQKSKGETSQDMKSQDKSAPDKATTEKSGEKSKDGMKAEKNGMKSDKEGMKAEKDGMKSDTKATTTGQAGAGGKQLNEEQRTTVRTAIKEQNVKSIENVNFSISVGTRVPRTVTFHALPTQLVTIYPEWRGYEYFLVNDQIIVVNPRTLEIVAVLEA